MIFFIVEWLRDTFGIHVPAAFGYTSSRAILAAVTALAVTLFCGSRFIKKLYELKIGQPIRDDSGFLLAELHKNKKNTPTMGGALIIFAIFVALFLWMDLTHPFTWLLFFTTLVLGALGGYDDYLKLRYKNAKGLSAKKKLLIQFLWSCVVIAYLQAPQFSQFLDTVFHLKIPVIKEFITSPQITEAHELSLFEYSSRLYFPFFKEPILIFSGIGLVILWAFFAFVIVGSSNAVNLTDGLDGLASGLVVFAAASLGVVAFLSNNMDMADYLNILYIEGSGEIFIFLAAVCGACLGFLWYNSHPAQVFMGDTGSLPLGGVLAVSAVLLSREFFYGLVGIIFVAEALSVIMQVVSYRYFGKKRIFLCAPLHHHFEYLGWAETKVVIRFWIIGLLLSLIGLASLKFQ
jgi:phospho-N-acetylmuramoyl-pentapeptide-transferase